MTDRSRFENSNELTYTVRVNGRIWAAFRRPTAAKDQAYALSAVGNAVVVTDQKGVEILNIG